MPKQDTEIVTLDKVTCSISYCKNWQYFKHTTMGKWETGGHQEISHAKIGFLQCRGGFYWEDKIAVWWRKLYEEEYYIITKGQQSNYTHQATEFKTHEAKWKTLRQRDKSTIIARCPASNSRITRQNQSEARREVQSTNKTKLAYFKKILLSNNITNPWHVCGLVIKV